jgi:hypothetical protein
MHDSMGKADLDGANFDTNDFIESLYRTIIVHPKEGQSSGSRRCSAGAEIVCHYP